MEYKQLRKDVEELIDAGVAGDKIDDYIGQNGFTPQEFKLASENYGTFMSAVKRGGKNMGSLLADWLPIMGANVLEKIAPDSLKPHIESYKERQLKEAQQTQEEVARKYPGQYESFTDIEGPMGALGYAKEALGENLTSFIPSVVTGGAAGIASRGAVAGANVLAKKASLEAAKKAALANVPGAAEEFVSGIAAKRAAEEGVKAGARKALQYEAAGAFGGSALQTIPEAYQGLYSPENQDVLLPAFASGTFNGLLDAITPISMLRTMKHKGLTGDAIMGAWYKRGAHELGKGILTEGTTEALQEMSNAAAEKYVDQHKEFFTPENLTRFIDAGLKGGIGGGVMQGATGVVFGKNAPKETPPNIPSPGPLTPAQAGATPLTAEPPYTPLTGGRDLLGMTPEGQLAKPTEEMRPIIGPDGKITGYEPMPPAAAPKELEGKQLHLQPAEEDLLTGQPSEQPTPLKAAPLVNEAGEPIGPKPGQPLPDFIREELKKAKADPAASSLLKANNPATANAVAARLEAIMHEAGNDPVKAMEMLYEENRTGKGKALSAAQAELLDVIYRRTTGRQIDQAIKERAFMGATQGDLFGGENAEGKTEPNGGTTPPNVGAPGEQPEGTTGGAEGAGPSGVGVGGSQPGVGGPTGGAGQVPATLSPEEAWNKHKNDDHPEYSALAPEDKAAWDKYVAQGSTGASAFQDVVESHNRKVEASRKKTAEEVKQIFKKEHEETTKDIENEIAGLDYDGLIKYMLANGPESVQGIMHKVADAVKRMKKMGYTFSFHLSQSSEQSRLLGLSGNSMSGAAGHVMPRGKHMELVISGRNAGRPFGGDFETVAHELLHSVTIPLIRYGEANPSTPEGRVVQELKDLSAHVKKELRKRERMGTATREELYYLHNTNAFGKYVKGWGTVHIADEIMSQGNTGSNFRHILETIEYKGKSAIDAFVEMVRKLIGLSPKENTALSELIRLSNKLFEGQIPMPTSKYGKKVSSVVNAKQAWHERETPNQFGREEALTNLYKKMQNAYDESASPDDAYIAAYENATKEEQYILRQLKKDGMLGFDYPHQAIQAIIEEPEAFDLSPQLKTAISKLGNKVVAFEKAGPWEQPTNPHASYPEAKQPTKEQIKDFFNAADKLEVPEGVAEIEDAWIGGVGDFGQKDVVYDLPWVKGYRGYRDDLEDLLRDKFGDVVTVYRLCHPRQIEQLQDGDLQDSQEPLAFTLSKDFAEAFRNFAGWDESFVNPQDLVLIEAQVHVEGIRMLGHRGESELVMGADEIGRFRLVPPSAATNSLSQFETHELPKGPSNRNRDFILKEGTAIFHGAHLNAAENIEASNKVLKARPGVKSGGGNLYEGDLIWFGGKHEAEGHSKSAIDRDAARHAEERGEKRLPGKVFKTIVPRDLRLVNRGYKLNAQEADALNTALGIPDYKPLRAGDDLGNAQHRGYTNGANVPKYELPPHGTIASPWPIILETLGYDGFYDETGIAIAAPNGIELGDGTEPMVIRPGASMLDDGYQGPIESLSSADVESAKVTQPAPTKPVPALGQPYTLPKLTKLEPAPTTGAQIKQTVEKVNKAFHGDWWTRFRIAAVDKASGLMKTLESLPVFQDGQLRADMLIRAFNQVINLIKNGLQSGIPVLNSDGTIVIKRSDVNLRRSQILADELDENSIVKGSGMSGRAYVAEIARIKRGEEIMQEDAAVRAKAEQMMNEARALRQKAKMLRQAGAPLGDILRMLNKAKQIQSRWSEARHLNREKQVSAEHIAWADKQLEAGIPQVDEVFRIWRETNVALIDLNEAAGNLDAETADRYRSKKYYVPLFASRVDLRPEEQEHYTGKRPGTKSVAQQYHLEGSMDIRNIWENMDKHYASATASAYQNQTRKIAVKQLMSDGINAARYAKNASDPNINLRFRDPTDPNADDNGIVHVILDNPNDLAAFQMMPQEIGFFLGMFSASTQALRAGALINPMYWIKQLIRDPLHAALVTNSGIVTPFHAAKEYVNVLANNSEEARILMERGVIGQIDPTMDIHDFLKQVSTEKLNPKKMDALIHKVMRMHEASDAATRVAIYKNAIKEGLAKGMSQEEATNYAVHVARESINFSVRGNSKILNTLRHMIPFFSAAITSLDTLYRAASGYGLNPTERKEIQRVFMSRAAMMVVLSTVYAMTMQDDDDYKKLPDNVKDDNWLMPSPLGSEHTFLKIPVPFEIGFMFKTIPEGAVRYMSDTSTGKEIIASYIRGLQRNLPGEAVLIPQAVKPALETITNYSFFNHRPIEGMSDQGLPVEMRGPNASEMSKTLSKLGLSEIGLSPAKIDHLVQGYMAELGTFSSGIASTMISKASGKEPPTTDIEKMPFFRAFLTDPNTSKAATDFYELSHNSQEAVNAFNRLKKEGRVEEAKTFMEDEEHRKAFAAAPAFRKVQDQMAKIRTAINYYENNQSISPEERRARINELQTMYDRVARQGYKIAEAAGISR